MLTECVHAAGKEDMKVSLHATIHIMDPAEHHKQVIEACLRRVKRECAAAYNAMVEKDSLKKGIHTAIDLKNMGDFAGFMAMDTAMTSNWHQPIQSIGSSKGDGIVFKHMMRVYFQPHADKLPVDLDKDVLYDVQENYFPTDDVHALAMLMAEHSASVPDALCISYLPQSKWKQDDVDLWKYAKGKASGSSASNRNALLASSFAAGCGRKRSLSEISSSFLNSGSGSSSTCSSPLPMALSCALGKDIHIPSWIVAYLSKAMFSYNASIFSNSLFSQCPYNLDAQRGFPEYVLPPNKAVDGTSLHTKGLPCIVHMVLHGIVKIHQKNCGAMWIASKARLNKDKGEELVFMKCWHPICQKKVSEYRQKAGESCLKTEDYMFDGNGWAVVCKRDLQSVIGNVEVDEDAKI
jgi:hypothetical protein